MATNNGSPHLQIRYNLSGLYLADWKWLHPIVITFNTLCLVKLCIQWCGALQWTRWRSPKFPKLISQLWGIPQPQYFITLLLEAHWTYFWKHYTYYKKDTKVGSQNFGYQIWFCTRLFQATTNKHSFFEIQVKHFLSRESIRNCHLALTHWGWATHLSWVIIGSGNGLSAGRCQGITCTNAELLLIAP